MATYTMELRTLVNSPYHEVFDFDYPFYCQDEQIKKEFEELFINHYYFHEIGAETVDRWKQMLKARLMVKMPYYRQLYLTEWEQTGKNMMNSKDLTETTTHTLKSNDNGNETVNGNATDTVNVKATDTVNDTTTSTQSEETSGTSSGNGTHDESYINDGTSVANTTEPYRTGSSKDVSSATSTSSGEVESSTTKNISSSNTNETKTTNTNETKTTNTNQTTLEEQTTFHSYGDIGIQTPAYAITEWRKVIINLNEMILNDLQDLFIQIY